MLKWAQGSSLCPNRMVPPLNYLQAIFDSGNPVASVGSTLLTMVWCPEVQRLAALAPQVPLFALAWGVMAFQTSKFVNPTFEFFQMKSFLVTSCQVLLLHNEHILCCTATLAFNRSSC